jgi:SHS2 domain-containing protein
MYCVKYLPHTADVRLKIEADSLEELFSGGARTINEILKPGFCKEVESNNAIVRKVEVHSIDLTALFIDFLSEILTLNYTEKAIFCAFDILELTNHSVIATAKGRKAPFFEEDVKAVTYHESDVHKNKSGNFESIVILDI